MSTGGSIEAVSIRGRNFSVAADADVTRKLGGFENAVEPNGDGTARKIMTRVAWSLSGIALDVNDTRGDHEFLQEIQNGENADVDGFYAIAITYASGAVYSGRGTVIDATEYASMASTISVSLAGPGDLIKQ
jgi:hypothetical protein